MKHLAATARRDAKRHNAKRGKREAKLRRSNNRTGQSKHHYLTPRSHKTIGLRQTSRNAARCLTTPVPLAPFPYLPL